MRAFEEAQIPMQNSRRIHFGPRIVEFRAPLKRAALKKLIMKRGIVDKDERIIESKELPFILFM